MASEIKRLQQEVFFFEKKKQKTFVNLGFACAGLATVGSEPLEQKLFASFFQKRCFLPLLQLVDFTYYLPREQR